MERKVIRGGGANRCCIDETRKFREIAGIMFPLCGKSGTERVERSFRLGVDKSGKVFSNCKLDKSREFLKSIKFESSKRR